MYQTTKGAHPVRPAALVFALATVLAAAPASVARAQESPPTPDTARLMRMACYMVEKRSKDGASEGRELFPGSDSAQLEKADFLYGHESVLWKLAGARPGIDDQLAARQNIQRFWTDHRDFGCDNSGTGARHILKYAVKNNFPEFIMNVVGDY